MLLRWHKQPFQWDLAGMPGRSRGGRGEKKKRGRERERERERKGEFWRGRGRFGAVIGRARAAGTMGELGRRLG